METISKSTSFDSLAACLIEVRTPYHDYICFTHSSQHHYIQRQPPEVFCEKGVLKYFEKFTGNTCARVSFLSSRCRCFPVNFAKFLKTSFLQNTPGRLPSYTVFLWDETLDSNSFQTSLVYKNRIFWNITKYQDKNWNVSLRADIPRKSMRPIRIRGEIDLGEWRKYKKYMKAWQKIEP